MEINKYFSIDKLNEKIRNKDNTLYKDEAEQLKDLLPFTEYAIYRDFEGKERYFIIRPYNIVMEILQ